MSCPLFQLLKEQAPAGFAAPVNKGYLANNLFCPTFTSAQPILIFLLFVGEGQDGPAVEFSAGIDFARLGHNSILVLAHGLYGLSSSEHPALVTSGARAFSANQATMSIA